MKNFPEERKDEASDLDLFITEGKLISLLHTKYKVHYKMYIVLEFDVDQRHVHRRLPVSNLTVTVILLKYFNSQK